MRCSFLSPRVNNGFIAVIVLTRFHVDKVNARSEITMTSMLTLHESSRFRHRDSARNENASKTFPSKNKQKKTFPLFYKRFLQITVSKSKCITQILRFRRILHLIGVYFKHERSNLLLQASRYLTVRKPENFQATNESLVRTSLRLCRRSYKNFKCNSFWDTLFKGKTIPRGRIPSSVCDANSRSRMGSNEVERNWNSRGI